MTPEIPRGTIIGKVTGGKPPTEAAHFWKSEACGSSQWAKRVRVNVTFIAMPRWRFRNWIEAIERPSSLAYIPTSERIAKPSSLGPPGDAIRTRSIAQPK
jgi:hypothetical protein